MKSRHLFWIIAVVLGASLFSAQGWATECRNDDDCPAGSPCVKIEQVGRRCLPDVGIWVGPLPKPLASPPSKQADKYIPWECERDEDCNDGSVCTNDGQCLEDNGSGTDDNTSDPPFLFVEHIPPQLPRMLARSGLRWLGSGRLVPLQLPPGTDVEDDETGDDPNDAPTDDPPAQPMDPTMEEVETIVGGGGCTLVAGPGASSGGAVALLLGFIAIAAASFRMRFDTKRTLAILLVGGALTAAAACSDGDDLGSGWVSPPEPQETAITIESVVPAEAAPGDPVEIRGIGLEEETDVVISGSTEVPHEEGAAGDGLITIKIPDDAQPGPFPIKVKRGDIESNEVVVTVALQVESKAMLSVSGIGQSKAHVEVITTCNSRNLSQTPIGNGECKVIHDFNVNVYTIEWKLPEGINEAVLYAPAEKFAADMYTIDSLSHTQRHIDVAYTPELFAEEDRETLASAVQGGKNRNSSDFIRALEKCTGKPSPFTKRQPDICKQLKIVDNAGSIKTVVSTRKRVSFTLNFIVLEYQDVDGTTKSETVEGPF